MTDRANVQAKAQIQIASVEFNIIQQIVNDRDIRLEVTRRSHYWFFHTYFFLQLLTH